VEDSRRIAWDTFWKVDSWLKKQQQQKIGIRIQNYKFPAGKTEFVPVQAYSHCLALVVDLYSLPVKCVSNTGSRPWSWGLISSGWEAVSGSHEWTSLEQLIREFNNLKCGIHCVWNGKILEHCCEVIYLHSMNPGLEHHYLNDILMISVPLMYRRVQPSLESEWNSSIKVMNLISFSFHS